MAQGVKSTLYIALGCILAIAAYYAATTPIYSEQSIGACGHGAVVRKSILLHHDSKKSIHEDVLNDIRIAATALCLDNKGNLYKLYVI